MQSVTLDKTGKSLDFLERATNNTNKECSNVIILKTLTKKNDETKNTLTLLGFWSIVWFISQTMNKAFFKLL